MNRQAGSVTRLAATALLVAVAAVGCARPGGTAPGQGAGSAPAALQSQARAAPTIVPTQFDAIVDSPVPSDPAADPTDGAGLAGAAATPDPLDGQLSNLGNLLNGINNALSGADTGSSGGE